MDIYPEDLDPIYRVRVQQMKKALSLQDGTFMFGRGFDGLLGAVCGMAPSIALNLWLHVVSDTHTDAVFWVGGAGAAVGYVCGLVVDRRKRSSRHTEKITAREINMLRHGETDALRLDYLGLVSKLISMRSSLDISAIESIRSALRNIGSGIEKLPSQPADDLLLNARSFQQEALRLIAEAAQETDPVVAESLRRQSIAQSQRGEAIARNFALSRRNEVLRREMREHIRAISTMLSATDLDDSSDGYNFTELTENIQQVATEAKSLTEAKRELVSALAPEQCGTENIIPEQTQLYIR